MPTGSGSVIPAALENLMTGERHAVEWNGVHLRLDPLRDPALLFRCLV
jgi:starch synthase (maltosyl-transferring)